MRSRAAGPRIPPCPPLGLPGLVCRYGLELWCSSQSHHQIAPRPCRRSAQSRPSGSQELQPGHPAGQEALSGKGQYWGSPLPTWIRSSHGGLGQGLAGKSEVPLLSRGCLSHISHSDESSQTPRHCPGAVCYPSQGAGLLSWDLLKHSSLRAALAWPQVVPLVSGQRGLGVGSQLLSKVVTAPDQGVAAAVAWVSEAVAGEWPGCRHCSQLRDSPSGGRTRNQRDGQFPSPQEASLGSTGVPCRDSKRQTTWRVT